MEMKGERKGRKRREREIRRKEYPLSGKFCYRNRVPRVRRARIKIELARIGFEYPTPIGFTFPTGSCLRAM